MHSLPLLRATLVHQNPFVCSPFLLHEMLSSVDAKLSETLEQSSTSSKGKDIGDFDGIPLRDLLLDCAEAVSQNEWDRARNMLSSLSSKVSVHGDSGERVAYYFTKALASRVPRDVSSMDESMNPSREEIHAAYLALNRATPFLRFAHLTANQALLELMEGEDVVHLVDFEIMQGVQWPPLMQAFAQRRGGPPHLRITGIGPALDILQQTGHRLGEFARSLDLPFEFLPLVVDSIENVKSGMLERREGEALAVNCVLQLYRLLAKRPDTLESFLAMIQSLSPKVVTLAEREANHNLPLFLDRFTEALQNYSTIFDSLEATLPPKSPDRVMVEEIWFGLEIANIVACDGSDWTERHERFERWRDIMERAGFQSIAPSTFALAQAKVLLRLHYPSEGYHLFEGQDCLLLGWQDHALFTVSSWH